jgi:hypothetical protein
MVGFATTATDAPELDGAAVDSINSDLSSGIDATTAKPLPTMKAISFQAHPVIA